MVNKEFEILNRIHLLMKYDSKSTLSENVEIILEQDNPPIPMPSTELPSDYTGPGGEFERTQTPTVSKERIKSEKLKQQEIDKDLNRPYPSSKEEGDRFRAWFNQVFPFKAKNPCGDGQKLDLTGTFDNKFIKCAADFDGYGKRAFKIFLEQKGGLVKVYKSASDREIQTGIPPGFSDSDWKNFNEKKKEREKECITLRNDLKSKELSERKKWKENLSNRSPYDASDSKFVPSQSLKSEIEKIENYCKVEIQNYKDVLFRPNFPFGISEEDYANYLYLKQTIEKTYQFDSLDKLYCGNKNDFEVYTGKKYQFPSKTDCEFFIDEQVRQKNEQLTYLEKQYGFVKFKPKTEEINFFDKWRLGIEIVGMLAISFISSLLTPETLGATSAVAISSAARARFLFELLLNSVFWGSIAHYDWKKGDVHRANVDILFIFLPFLHEVPIIKQVLSKFSSQEVVKYSSQIAEYLKTNPIRSAQDAEKFLNLLKSSDPKLAEFFMKAVKLDPTIVKKGFEYIENSAIKDLGEKKAYEIFMKTAKEMGISTSFKTSVPELFGGGSKYLTNSKIVNAITKFGASLSIDLPIIEAFASAAYNFLDGKGVEQEIAFQRLMDYYSSIGDAKQRELEIKKDTEGLKKNDPKTQDKIIKIAKNEYGEKKQEELFGTKEKEENINNGLMKLKNKLDKNN
jgi:hypothetical protein